MHRNDLNDETRHHRYVLPLPLAAVLTIAAVLLPAASFARGAAGPTATSMPRILGAPVAGNTVTATSGTWSGTTPLTFSYRWIRCQTTSPSSCVVIHHHGARATYRVRPADVGFTLRLYVTATNVAGKTPALSAATDKVAAAQDKPVSLTAPAVVGKPEVGGTLNAKPGDVTGDEPVTMLFDWRSCGKFGSTCVDVNDRGTKTYTLTSKDEGKRLRVRVTVRNAAGTTWTASLPTALVSPAVAATAPQNTGEPRITGTPRVGQVLRTSRGTWTGTTPITYRYRWFRCEGRGAPDASDCTRIANAADDTYTLRQADAGFRIRSQVVATNADGSATATSNPTDVIQSALPVNTTEPSISGTPIVGNRLTASRGSWVGDTPITYAFQWLRCSQKGDNCSEIAGASDNTYVVVDADVGRTLRVRVTARNDFGSRSALSNETAVVRSQPQPPAGNVVDAKDLKAAGDRLVVSQVRFQPNPITNPQAVITVRIRVTDQRGRAVRGALVFIRSVPRRTTGGDRQPSASDGWVTYQLDPLRTFPRVNGNMQFFVKAYRAGDPVLGGIAGYRLVQVRLLTR